MAILSLGAHCYTAALLKELELPRLRSPFDWLFSSPEMVLHALRDGCRTLLDPRYAAPNGEAFDHTLYRERFGVERIFNHHDPRRDQAYFRAAVENLRRPAAFLMISTRHAPPWVCEDIAALLPGPSTFVEVTTMQLEPLLVEAVRTERHRLLHYHPSSALKGLVFENPADHARLGELARSVALDFNADAA